eukprot:399283-Rhodomonas_salina.9
MPGAEVSRGVRVAGRSDALQAQPRCHVCRCRFGSRQRMVCSSNFDHTGTRRVAKTLSGCDSLHLQGRLMPRAIMPTMTIASTT